MFTTLHDHWGSTGVYRHLTTVEGLDKRQVLRLWTPASRVYHFITCASSITKRMHKSFEEQRDYFKPINIRSRIEFRPS